MDLRIMALGAMALLIAAFGASTAAHRHDGAEDAALVQDRTVAGDVDGIRTGSIRVIDRGTHVDGFDLKH